MSYWLSSYSRAFMRIAICFFSGTGNTAKVSSRLREELSGLGAYVDLKQIVKDSIPPSGYDCICIAYPVHAFNAPSPVLRFVKMMPVSTVPVYLIQTSGEPLQLNKAAVSAPSRLLERKGYDVKGFFWYVMPYNIIFRHSDGMAARMWRTASLCIHRDADAIVSLRECRWRIGIHARLVSSILRIEQPAMPLIGRGFTVSDKCIGCGECARNCPMENIVLESGRPVFGKSCAGCMGCSFRCPVDAVRIGVLDGWRVNGPYDFEAESVSDDGIPRYCRKSYLEYFHSRR